MALHEFVAYLDHHDMIDASKIHQQNDDGYDNRLKLQKYAYLARSFGLDMGYTYNVHMFGPYSEQLTKEHHDMDLKNLDGTHVPPGLDCDKFLHVLEGKNADWLEIASTIIEENEYEGSIDLDHLYMLKDDYEPAFINSVYDDVKQLKLVST